MEESNASTEEFIWRSRKYVHRDTLSKVVMYSEKDLRERAHLIDMYKASSENFNPHVAFQHTQEEVMMNGKHLEESSFSDSDSQHTSNSSLHSMMDLCLKTKRDHMVIINYSDLELTDEEKEGFLTDRIIASGSLQLGYCPTSRGYVYKKLCLSNKNLSSISLLQFYRYLQIIILSHNHLEDINPISAAKYLCYLDVSYNYLRTVPGFAAPMSLSIANFSHNLVNYLEDFGEFSVLQKLYLSHNNINKVKDLNKLRFLEYLDLAHNRIDTLENITNLTVYHLNLEGNLISCCASKYNKDFPILKNIKYLNFSCNQLTTVLFFKEMHSLQELEIKCNNLNNLVDISHLKSLRNLIKLDLRGNEVTSWEKYRMYVINMLPMLCCLDGNVISLLEKIEAKTELDPDMHLIAACIQTRNKVLENWDQSYMGPHNFSIDQNIHPTLILVGPPGSMKGMITNMIAKTMPDKVHIAVSHTTRLRRPQELNGTHYYFVTKSEFSTLATSGAFLCVSSKLGQNYGLGWAEFSIAIQKNCLCLSHMDLAAALQLYSSRLQPLLILTLPKKEHFHMETLRSRYLNEELKNNHEGRGKNSVEMKTNHLAENEGNISSDNNAACLAEETVQYHYTFLSNKQFLEQYLRKLLASREQYLELCDKNPGLFLKTIYTDDPEEAMKQVKEIIQSWYKDCSCHFPSYPKYQKIICPETLISKLDAFELDLKVPY